MKTNIRAKYGTTTTALLSVGHREVYRSKKGLLMNWDKIKETKAYQRFSVFANEILLLLNIWVWLIYEFEKEIIRPGDFVETKKMVLMK